MTRPQRLAFLLLLGGLLVAAVAGYGWLRAVKQGTRDGNQAAAPAPAASKGAERATAATGYAGDRGTPGLPEPSGPAAPLVQERNPNTGGFIWDSFQPSSPDRPPRAAAGTHHTPSRSPLGKAPTAALPSPPRGKPVTEEKAREDGLDEQAAGKETLTEAPTDAEGSLIEADLPPSSQTGFTVLPDHWQGRMESSTSDSGDFSCAGAELRVRLLYIEDIDNYYLTGMARPDDGYLNHRKGLYFLLEGRVDGAGTLDAHNRRLPKYWDVNDYRIAYTGVALGTQANGTWEDSSGCFGTWDLAVNESGN